MIRKLACLSVLVLGVTGAVRAGEGGTAEKARARAILKATGVKKGLVVHLGCGDGVLTAALGADQGYLVHGLDADAANVEKARSHIRSLGIYGRVSVERLTGRRLPYAENLVNLLVADRLGDVPMAEVKRVLAPGGVAYLRKAGKWAKTVKPRPKEMGEWSHARCDAAGTAVAKDTALGVPVRLRWIDGPMRGRGHYYGPWAAVSAGGRNFYVVDDATPFLAVPRRPVLVARDAFNGLVLWKRPMFPKHVKEEGEQIIRGLKGEPRFARLLESMKPNGGSFPFVRKTLVAVGDRVYTPIEKEGPLVALAAATGKLLTTYDGASPREVLHHDGKLVVLSKGELRCLQAADGRKLWSARFGARDAVVGGGRVFCLDLAKWPPEVVSLGLADGKERWRKSTKDIKNWPAEQPGTLGKQLMLLFHDNGRLMLSGYTTAGGQRGSGPNTEVHMLSAKDGKHLWSYRFSSRGGGNRSPNTVFPAGGLIWVADTGQKRGESARASGWYGLDPVSGEKKRHSPMKIGQSCQPFKATARYMLFQKMDFMDVATGKSVNPRGARGVCDYGLLPANGLVYTFPTDCVCWPLIRGHLALAPAGGKLAEAHPLDTGPAAGKVGTAAVPAPGDWPCYRHDPERSGRASASVPAGLKQLWEKKLGGKLSAPTVAGGLAMVASADSHQVHALEAATGKPRWSYTAGARVDFPPAIYKGLCLFGCRDGWVYCLRASDGKLVWRFRAAPGEARIWAHGQLESPWPVAGGVLVDEGAACFVAGRHSALDGGVYAFAVNLQTGKVIWQVKPTGTVLADMLVKNGKALRMGRSWNFNSKTGQYVRERGRGSNFLTAGSTFLSDLYAPRSVWGYGGARGTKGHLLVLGKDAVFGVAAGSTTNKKAWVHPGRGDYKLFRAGGGGKSKWSVPVPLRMRALVLAGERLFVAGEEDSVAPGRSELRCFSAADGKELSKVKVSAPPAFDGMAAAGGRLYLSTEDGVLRCFGEK